jgi:DNA-binding NarL/FixJ family response regulator
MKVFIADDSAVLCERLIEMLSDIPGIEIIGHARDVPGTIASIKKLNPDIVILDIRMPGGSGIDVLQDVKKEKQAPMVIILTNYPYPQYRKKCLGLGADYFFDKSTEFERIPEVLKELIQNAEPRGKIAIPGAGN